MLSLLHLSVSGFLSLLNQDSCLLGCRTEVVALLQKDGVEGEGEDSSREKKAVRKRGADVRYIGLLCRHQHNGPESHHLSENKITILIPLPSPL